MANLASFASLATILTTVGVGLASGFWTYIAYNVHHQTNLSTTLTYTFACSGIVLFLIGAVLLYNHFSMNYLIASVVLGLIAGVAGFFTGKLQFDSDIGTTPTPTFVPTSSSFNTLNETVRGPAIPPDELAKICKDVDITNLPKSWCDCMCQLGGSGACFKQCNGATCWKCVNSSVDIPPNAYERCMCASGGEANGPCTNPTICFGR
jgi:hypothetical protein